MYERIDGEGVGEGRLKEIPSCGRYKAALSTQGEASEPMTSYLVLLFGGVAGAPAPVVSRQSILRCWPNPVDGVGITPSCAGWGGLRCAVETKLPRLKPDTTGSSLLPGSQPAKAGSPANI